MSAQMPTLVLGGVSSGVGKTTITCALIRAFAKRGLRVAPYKCGPDYLDPSYLSRAAGRTAHNLDSWMMGKEALRSTFARTAKGADLAIVEGVMGIFDGARPDSEEGSTAQIAKWLGAPAILVMDAGGMARTIAALLHGFADFDSELQLVGAICNRVGSPRHLELLRQALPEQGAKILGGLPKNLECTFSERHLGLIEARKNQVPDAVFDALADLVETWFDLDELLELAKKSPVQLSEFAPRPAQASCRARIGIAQDEAFSFYYPENLALLEHYGAQLVPFSPMQDKAMPDVDALYFGGGYPELHAKTLADNLSMKASVLEFVSANRPVYAECGGMMYLSQGIETLDGLKHEMVGALSGWAKLRDKLVALGYTEVSTTRASILGPAGTSYRGHQFRYSMMDAVDPAAVGALELSRRRDGAKTAEGYWTHRTVASYVHAHWASNPEIPRFLVQEAVKV